MRERLPDDPTDPTTVIYDLEGEFFFGAAPELDRYFDTLRARIHDDGIRFVILRLKRVRDPDAVCIERLEHFLRTENGHGASILLAGVRPDTLKVLYNIGFAEWFPAEQVFPEEDQKFSATLRAVRYAREHLGIDEPDRPADDPRRGPEDDSLYYLV